MPDAYAYARLATHTFAYASTREHTRAQAGTREVLHLYPGLNPNSPSYHPVFCGGGIES